MKEANTLRCVPLRLRSRHENTQSLWTQQQCGRIYAFRAVMIKIIIKIKRSTSEAQFYSFRQGEVEKGRGSGVVVVVGDDDDDDDEGQGRYVRGMRA
jgi:hypothetical protein